MDNQNQANSNQNPPANANQSPQSLTPRQQIVARIKQANNVLVTVSNNPSVDQLTACIGLTLMINKLGKHAAAVFSGEIPHIMEFLKPEKTIEKNTDSLQDFIISLDKSKADKLRYKVEDKVVKIFITPYRTSISEKDLEFSQGDLNVDAIVTLGVKQQQELDQAVTAHGRILHDATVISITNSSDQGNLGTINWQDTTVSSLSEMITDLSQDFDDKSILDAQVATALLTGIVAITKRFSNDKTSPQTMSASAILLGAGANQQLVATELEPPTPPPPPPAPTPPPPPPKPEEKTDSGTLTIEHDDQKKAKEKEQEEHNPEDDLDQIHIDNQGVMHSITDEKPKEPTEEEPEEEKPTPLPPPPPAPETGHSFMASPPSSVASVGSVANPQFDIAGRPLDDDEDKEGDLGGLSLPPISQPLLDHAAGNSSSGPQNHESETLEQIEKDVNSPHLQNEQLEAARSVANSEASEMLKPITALGAQHFGSGLHLEDPMGDINASPGPSAQMPMPPSITPLPNASDPTSPSDDVPPVPPPLVPPVV